MDINNINNFLVNITAALKNVQLYIPTHPLIGKSIDKSIESLENIFQELDEITFIVIENELIVKGYQLGKLVSCSLNLAKTLKRSGIEWLSFKKGVQKDELISFISHFIRTKEQKIIAADHIKIGTVNIKTKLERQKEKKEDEPVLQEEKEDEIVFEYIKREELESIQELYLSAQRHKKLDIVGIEDIVGQFVNTFQQELSPLLSLASLKSFDDYTYVHTANVCILTMAQAESLGISGDALHDIGIAAMVHDVGKTFIPDEILNKQGKLTPEEWDIMMSHPAKGVKYLNEMPGIPNLAILVAFEHHMKNDLSGYPKVDGPYKLHPASKMTNIADVYDALSTKRPYRDPMPREKIFNLLREGAGTEFDPFFVENFISMMGALHK